MNLIIFGPQASGKGTQAQLLARKFNGVHVEMGQILRDIARQDTDRGRLIKSINDKKELTPDSLVMEIIEENIRKISKGNGIIFDGIPRTQPQIKPAEKLFSELGIEIKRAIYIKLSRELSIERITKRYNCMHCGNRLVLGVDIQSKNDKCPICGGFIEQRSDDTPDGVIKRLDAFYELTIPVVDYYRKNGLLIEVDGNQTVEKVFDDIVSKLK